jgi:hypothetical protein
VKRNCFVVWAVVNIHLVGQLPNKPFTKYGDLIMVCNEGIHFVYYVNNVKILPLVWLNAMIGTRPIQQNGSYPAVAIGFIKHTFFYFIAASHGK